MQNTPKQIIVAFHEQKAFSLNYQSAALGPSLYNCPVNFTAYRADEYVLTVQYLAITRPKSRRRQLRKPQQAVELAILSK